MKYLCKEIKIATKLVDFSETCLSKFVFIIL